MKSKYTELSQSFQKLQKKEIENKKRIKQLNHKISRIQSKLNENDENYLNFEQEINGLTQRNAELQQQIDNLTNETEQKVEMPPIPRLPVLSAQNSLLAPVDTWQIKAVTDWSCQELQSWIRSVGLSENEITDLLVAVNRTKTTGQQFERLHNAQAIHDRFIEDGFDIEENVAIHIADNLPRRHSPPPAYNNNNNNNDKVMEEWDCNELQEWVRSLNISEGHRDLLIHSIIEMECTGSDLASCKSAQEVLDSFDEINEHVAIVIFSSFLK